MIVIVYVLAARISAIHINILLSTACYATFSSAAIAVTTTVIEVYRVGDARVPSPLCYRKGHIPPLTYEKNPRKNTHHL